VKGFTLQDISPLQTQPQIQVSRTSDQPATNQLLLTPSQVLANLLEWLKKKLYLHYWLIIKDILMFSNKQPD
jgi:hypothetical protein